MIILILLAALLILFGVILLAFLQRQKKNFGLLQGDHFYVDTKERSEDILISRTIPLRGKPDYIAKEGKYIIPKELKTGKTPPYEAYLNHTMQLMAYCYLVEEIYGVRPPGGYIKYPSKEFKLEYTDEAKESVKRTVAEMMAYKKTNVEFFCKHPQHNLE
ncbi:MAG TPA: Dna2/Cas4 domain-containing protein [Candidatus Saccharimonadales bacterium]|nr:Dna2/Cas4 domain-containing protein [Candidatus Saccharimonadales bacterium]